MADRKHLNNFFGVPSPTHKRHRPVPRNCRSGGNTAFGRPIHRSPDAHDGTTRLCQVTIATAYDAAFRLQCHNHNHCIFTSAGVVDGRRGEKRKAGGRELIDYGKPLLPLPFQGRIISRPLPLSTSRMQKRSALFPHHISQTPAISIIPMRCLLPCLPTNARVLLLLMFSLILGIPQHVQK